ncbi:type II toxin-antitoxin system Phd/YefM family antitoxin [Endozoicomonas sp. SESOKO1]|uniref:type II toxin-antitoxin system Phd/YefM family antitoxin n=1 Tax=Endozoicomonas sp. SESOKO1 TaxID=2828742 RepID=UPI002147441D|nr:type II toxin-antitoxin system prevent-host-death family antitoxin [Endozoicomonas sp. SESOKO1]
MEQINISELRANLLSYLKKAQAGQAFQVTSNGEVLATISSPDTLKQSARQALDELAKDAKLDDIITGSHETWDANQ